MERDTSYYDAVDLLKKILSIPAISREETLRADFLENEFRRMNLFPQRKGNNVWILSPEWDDSKPIVLLNTHIDTVKPVSGWSREPFVPSEEDGKLYGLGSNDAGASLVSLLYAFLQLTSRKQPNNFIFLLSCEEEVSGKGGIELVLPELPPIALAVVGEPTGMQPAIAEKGLMVIDGLVEGTSGHAAREEGDNAIYKTLPVIDWFRTLQFPRESDWLGPVKTTVTLIQSGTQHNVIPDACSFTVDVRTNECYSNNELFEIITSQCPYPCKMTARSFWLNSSHIPLTHPFVKRADYLGLEAFGSPTLSDQALMNFPSVKIGPGKSSRSHTADEFIELTEIREAIDLYIRLLNDLKV